MNKAYVIIPARLGSTRLPNKLLLDKTGKTVIQHTYEAVKRASLPAGVLVAADDQRIVDVVNGFGGEAVLTSIHHPSGTDRVAEACASLPDDVNIILNVQGDEPEIDPAVVDHLIRMMDRPCNAATLCTPIRSRLMLIDPACVKVVFDRDERAVYFSRSPIPYVRDQVEFEPGEYYQHIGIYAYRRDFLQWISQVEPTKLELLEKLEQLRIIESGYSIRVGVVEYAQRGIDTKDDYTSFVLRQFN